MIRAGLALWFGAISLLGPDVCCCSMQRFFASRFVESAGPNIAPSRGRCPNCVADSSKRQSNDQFPSRNHSPGRCPCKERSGQLTAMPSPVSGLDEGEMKWVANGWRVEFMFAFRLAVEATTDPSSPDQRSRIVPFLDSEDILFVLHIMRC